MKSVGAAGFGWQWSLLFEARDIKRFKNPDTDSVETIFKVT